MGGDEKRFTPSIDFETKTLSPLIAISQLSLDLFDHHRQPVFLKLPPSVLSHSALVSKSVSSASPCSLPAVYCCCFCRSSLCALVPFPAVDNAINMVLSLTYRRPARVSRDSVNTGRSGAAESTNSGLSCPFGIPDALSFDRIINGGTCPVSFLIRRVDWHP